MKKGYVKITNKTIQDALNFPVDWEIEEIKPSFDDYGNRRIGESIMLISGKDFPETNNRGEAENVTIIVHKEAITFEVKCIG